MTSLAEPVAGEVRTNPKDGAKIVWIPAGDFLMGISADDVTAIIQARPAWKASMFADQQPQHTVSLDGYWIYKYEVTIGQYRKFCTAVKRTMPELPKWATNDNMPMVNVTWYEAAAYADWAKADLPTEAQWEHAARGTDNTLYPWGNNWDEEKCNNFSDHVAAGGGYQAKQASVVGSYPAGTSKFGVDDMAGNVWEWCQDWYDPTSYNNTTAKNPTGPEKGELKVMRGGTWGSNSRTVMSVFRISTAPELTYHDDGGFRCVVPGTTQIPK